MKLQLKAIPLAVLLLLGGCALSKTYTAPAAEEFLAPADDAGKAEISVLLIGDAGAPSAEGLEPVLQVLRAESESLTGQKVVVFLGDNIYPKGLPRKSASGHDESIRRIDAQVACLASVRDAHVRFIPGNHDYYQPDKFGGVVREALEVERNGAKFNIDVKFRPETDGPTPLAISGPEPIGTCLSIIYLDAHEFLLEVDAAPNDPGEPSKAELQLKEMLYKEKQAGRLSIVVGHYPLASHGRHGGFYSWEEHIFPLHELFGKIGYAIPLPIVGSLYPLIRGSGCIGKEEDMATPSNRKFVEALKRAFQGAPPIAYISGHEHTLQVIRQPNVPWILVSGAGYLGRQESLTVKGDTMFASPEAGFLRLDVFEDRKVKLTAIEVTEQLEVRRALSMWLSKEPK